MELLNLDVVREFGGALLQGLGITVVLTLIVITMALILAIPVALIRMSPNFLLRTIGSIYVEVIRGTPLLLQLAYIYYVMPGFGLNLDPFSAAILGLTLNYTAYMSEVYRGGILAVPKHQWEAAATVGMTRAVAFYRIILPQALRIVTPTLGNYSFTEQIKIPWTLRREGVALFHANTARVGFGCACNQAATCRTACGL